MGRNITRILQRYLLPRFIVSLIYFVKYRCLISTGAHVQMTRRIQIGKGSTVKAFSVIQTSGGHVILGKHCTVNNFVHIATTDADVVLGDYVLIGPNVTILGGRGRYKDPNELILNQGYTHRGVKVGNDVLIGAGCVLMECTVGEGAVLGAGSVVIRDVPPYTVVSGVPAKAVAKRGNEDEDSILVR